MDRGHRLDPQFIKTIDCFCVPQQSYECRPIVVNLNMKFKKKPLQISILSSTDEEIRYHGSSGGVVTAIAKYLFGKKLVSSAIAYKFGGPNLFVPYLAFGIEDYSQTGSIYHEVELFGFIRENLDRIKSPVFVTCLPCQAKSIKIVLEKNGIEAFVVALVCSEQLTKDATYDFLKRNKIRIEDIEFFRYRGNGWPSGMTVFMKNDKSYFFDNLSSEWPYFFHSTIYNLKKCFCCLDTFGYEADLSVADPWLKRYKNNEKIGCSIVSIYSEEAKNIIKQMLKDGFLNLHEEIDYEELKNSQRGTIRKKDIYIKNKKAVHFLVALYRNRIYKIFFMKFPKLHCKLHNILLSLIVRVLG